MDLGNILQSILGPILNNFKITAMALEHNPYILLIILIAFVFFLVQGIRALKASNIGASSTLKFAPSVLTSLGLLGTFFALTTSLTGLQINESGNISNEGLSSFIESLQSVFSFSILGIGSAILFMIINFLILSRRNNQISTQKDNHKTEAQNRQTKMDTLNQSTLQELKNQNYHLNNLANISSKNDLQSDHLQQISMLIKRQNESQETQSEAQQQLFITLSGSLTRMSNAIANIETGYDMNMLGDVISKKIGEVLTEPLAQMTLALEKNNSDVIHKLLADLKEDILLPIKDEIKSTNETTNKVITSVNDSQKTNTQLIAKLGDVTTQMDSFVTNTETLVTTMVSTVGQMETLQENQDKTLKEFNTDLQDNLAGIQPAIEQGMNAAKDGMVNSITLATTAMNTAMTGVISQISKDVVENLGNVLNDFNTNMDGHLNRMNSELAATGSRASDLIDSSANNLKETLGDIDKTLDESSTKLKEELQAFRDEYQFSLDTFFTQQNKELEKTLGVQNERLQKTADQLGKQFEGMDEAQRKLNEESLKTIDKSREVYEPLLNQMATIATTLNQGQGTLIKDLRAMQDHTDDINDALKELGQTMPKEFTNAFELLNQAYVDKFNSTNEVLEKMMKEMITASAVLLTASNSKNQDGE